MPAAAQVKHSKFPVVQILYDDGDFSIAWGTYDEGHRCIGMRWNGDGDDAGYPKLFQNPVWFVLPAALSVPFVKSLLGTRADNKAVLRVLEELEGSGALNQ